MWKAAGLAGALMAGLAGAAGADTPLDMFAPQYIAALGDPRATSGNDAETWGLWEKDPGPRGVMLSQFAELMATGGVAKAGWSYDPEGWWLEEHGLIMEAPSFPVPTGDYVVTGGRQVTALLTIAAPDAEGHQAWSLSDGATLHDVTHLGCRAAIYTAGVGPQACMPQAASPARFPVTPGAAMPPVEGCAKQDYQVLIVIGKKAASDGS